MKTIKNNTLSLFDRFQNGFNSAIFHILKFIQEHLLISTSIAVLAIGFRYMLHINLFSLKSIGFLWIITIIEIYFWMIIKYMAKLRQSHSFVTFIGHLTSFSVISILLFGWYYATFNDHQDYLHSIINTAPIQSFSESVYFSGVTFISIGYGDIVPVGIFQIVSLTEAFIGSFITLSFFTIGITQLHGILRDAKN